MNPVLLKPTSDVGAQVVVLGKARMNRDAQGYHAEKRTLLQTACDSLDRLRADHDLIIMEGAGSCAEVNLMDHDIVNLPMAAYAEAPVILVADIDRGGVFAQVVGTLACLDQQQRSLIKGVIINRFRGDIALFKEGVDWLEKKTGIPVLGVLPWYSDFTIEAEDSVVIERPDPSPTLASGPAIAVIRLPHISNFTDFDPLQQLNGLQVAYLKKPCDLSRFTAVILPGSKNTCSDLSWLNTVGWHRRLHDYVDQGGNLLGVCGGYQMLGRIVQDPDGIEGEPGEIKGLSLLPVETVLKAPKTTTRTVFSWGSAKGMGYEIHMGQTRGIGADALFKIASRNQKPCDDTDGCFAKNGRVMGSYIHGLFDMPAITRRWLDHIGLAHIKESGVQGPDARDRAYDQLAKHFLRYIDVTLIDQWIEHYRRGAA
jgi:adenosylcobyric acid synthase